MDTKLILEDKLKELKLIKRTFVLEGKNTEEIDYKIKNVEEQIKKNLSE
ncbi:hypothetical protein [uncultured Clostridium sp.]|nr:hypothetical protein [uncultured Clostridium sp.]